MQVKNHPRCRAQRSWISKRQPQLHFLGQTCFSSLFSIWVLGLGSGLTLNVSAAPLPQAPLLPLPHAALEIKVPVATVDGTTIFLAAGWRDQLRVGMTLNLFDEQDKLVGELRLTQVEPNRAQGTLIAAGPVDAATLLANYASAPYPLVITGIEGNTVTFLLPPGNRQLHPGDALTIVRNGEPMAALQFQSYHPVSALITQVQPGLSLQPGDIAWAYGVALNAPLPPNLVPLVPNPVPGTPGTVGNSTVTPIVPTPEIPATPPAGGSLTQVPSAVAATPRIAPPDATDIFTVKEDVPVHTRIATPTRLAVAETALSRSGATGLIRMPSADITPEGRVRASSFSYDKSRDLDRLGNVTTYAASIGFLPHLEVGATVGNDRQGRDITANAKVRIVAEKGSLPAIAIGVAEIKKTQSTSGNTGTVAPTLYVAASKHLFNQRVNATVGIQNQRRGLGTKPYGGLEIGVAKNVAAIVEHDSRNLNYGVRANLWHDRVQVGAQHLEGRWTSAVSVQFGLNNRHAAPPTVTLPRLGAQLSAQDAVQATQARLTRMGLENVTVRVLQLTPATGPVITNLADIGASPPRSGGGTGTALEITYENRSFPHNEMDALSNVLATAAIYAPPAVDRLVVVVERSAIPIIRIACPLDDYLRFMDGRFDEKSFKPSFQTSYRTAEEPVAQVLADSKRGASSYGHADVFLRPGLTTALATENYILGLGFNLQPELNLPLARGVGLDARGVVPIAGPLRADHTTYDRLALNYSTKLSSLVLARAFAGRFPTNRDGVLLDALITPDNSPLRLRAALGLLKKTSDFPDQKPTYVGEARYYLPSLDLTARLAAGRFLDGDKGGTAELLRRFGDTEVGLEYRSTNNGRVALVRVGIPLGPSYLSTRPSTLRVRPPDFFDYSQRAGLATHGGSNFVDVANATGNELAVGSDATQSLLDRDRLNRPYLLNFLTDLRLIRGLDDLPTPPTAPSVAP